MGLLKIHIFDDPVLRQKAEPITEITERHHQLARDMAETMYAAPGIGLAANQIGILERIIVLDVGWPHLEEDDEDEKQPLAMINPEILEESVEDDEYSEGCLSLPEIEGDVWRPSKITVRYQALSGETVTKECEGLYGRCVQHEIDHLNGILFFDRMAEAKRRKLTVALRELGEREPEEGQTRSAKAPSGS